MKLFALIFVALLLDRPAVAQDLFIYPARNQSKQQMEKDKHECYLWAKGETAFDPMTTTPGTSAQPAPKKSVGGGVAKGSVRGAAVGAGIGVVAGSPGKRAGTGAVVGGALGGVKRNAQNKGAQKAVDQQNQQQLAEYQRNQDNYKRANIACLEGRGYAVE